MRSLNGNCQNCSNGNELIILENKYNSSFLRSEDLRWNRPGPELEKQYYCWTSKVWYPCSCQTCVRRQETGAISRFIFPPPPPPPPFSYVVMLLGAGVRGGGGVTWLLLSLQMYNRLIISQNNLTYRFLAKALLHHHLYCDNKRFVFYRKINTIMTGPSYQIKNGKQQIKF